MKNKGFTLIELLAVITIIGIVMIIGIPAVSDLVKNAREKSFYINEEQLKKTAEQYYAENGMELPRKVNQSSIVFLNDLVDQGYSEVVRNPKDENNDCDGYVLVTKTSTSTYSYNPFLKCGNDYLTSGYYATPPVLKLKGINPLDLHVGDTYTEAGATAIDVTDGDITASITKTGSVNTSVTGLYYVTYSVTDSKGLTTEVKREVSVTNIVEKDTTPPVIALLGSSLIYVNQGGTYTDAGATAFDDVDGVITSKIVVSSTVNTATLGIYSVTYNVTDKSGNKATEVTRNVYVVPVPSTYAYTGAVQTYTIPLSGRYKIEVWGAQGGNSTYGVGGNGAYATGIISLNQSSIINIYVGGQGQMSGGGVASPGGWNGGGNGGAGTSYPGSGGGGASDIRIGGTNLSNRIIVAAGGGGCNGRSSNSTSYIGNGGYGGGPDGGPGLYSTASYNGLGATLSAGGAAGTGGSGTAATAGDLGIGGAAGYYSSYGGGGGGGGYYGGGGGVYYYGGGGGGSSYIDSTLSNKSMIAGNATMPAPAGSTETGHTGNGYVKITYAQ